MEWGDSFTDAASVKTSRILYTPSGFAKASLLHLQEVGSLTATAPHTSKRDKLSSYLCFVVKEGTGELIYEGQTHSLKAGDVVFVDCKKPYSHSTGSSLWTLQWCHFYGPSMAAIYSKYCQRGGRAVIHCADSEAFSILISELYTIASGQDYIRDMRINEKLNALLTLLMESSWQGEARSDLSKKMDIGNIRAYLDQHYIEKITLEVLSETFFVDKFYLARLFKEQYGLTVISYLQQVRVTNAKKLLRFTNMSIEEIGLQCGFSELSYFSRVFKKLEGVSPSEFRNLW